MDVVHVRMNVAGPVVTVHILNHIKMDLEWTYRPSTITRLGVWVAAGLNQEDCCDQGNQSIHFNDKDPSAFCGYVWMPLDTYRIIW